MLFQFQCCRGDGAGERSASGERSTSADAAEPMVEDAAEWRRDVDDVYFTTSLQDPAAATPAARTPDKVAAAATPSSASSSDFSTPALHEIADYINRGIDSVFSPVYSQPASA